MANVCCAALTVVFTLIFMACGGVLLAIGIVTKMKLNQFESFSVANIGYVAEYVIAVGGVIIFITLTGCIGAAIGSKCLLSMFGCLMFLLFICEVTATALAFIYKNRLEEAFADFLLSSSLDLRQMDRGRIELWRFLQTKLECCGYDDNRNWLYNAFPPSCCKMATGSTTFSRIQRKRMQHLDNNTLKLCNNSSDKINEYMCSFQMYKMLEILQARHPLMSEINLPESQPTNFQGTLNGFLRSRRSQTNYPQSEPHGIQSGNFPCGNGKLSYIYFNNLLQLPAAERPVEDYHQPSPGRMPAHAYPILPSHDRRTHRYPQLLHGSQNFPPGPRGPPDHRGPQGYPYDDDSRRQTTPYPRHCSKNHPLRHRLGCKDAVKLKLSNNFRLIAIVALTTLTVQLLGASFGCCLGCLLKNKRRGRLGRSPVKITIETNPVD